VGSFLGARSLKLSEKTLYRLSYIPIWGFGKIGELKVVLDDELLKAFKERAYKIFGYKKGSLKAAVELAIKDFIKHVNLPFPQTVSLYMFLFHRDTVSLVPPRP